ncbi:MAG: Lrp/AsnC family transcriptional regulator [Promethearchaeota archaeon]|jgi:DNA-binding Lrp family transcriptional regulator|nr:MAG: Lrp/AsnC family transcriptional regulator [Candidatus Lokiarchaeota archaeon]
MEDSNSLDIDEVDLDILKILSEDGRIAFNKIAEELTKSPVTIKKHVLELEEKGIIEGYGAKINFDKLGYNLIAFIEITISKGKMFEVEEKIARNPNVFGVYDITGTYDALVLARFKSRTQLSDMIKDIHKSPYVERTNTHIILNVIKEGTNLTEILESENYG